MDDSAAETAQPGVASAPSNAHARERRAQRSYGGKARSARARPDVGRPTPRPRPRDETRGLDRRQRRAIGALARLDGFEPKPQRPRHVTKAAAHRHLAKPGLGRRVVFERKLAATARTWRRTCPHLDHRARRDAHGALAAPPRRQRRELLLSLAKLFLRARTRAPLGARRATRSHDVRTVPRRPTSLRGSPSSPTPESPEPGSLGRVDGPKATETCDVTAPERSATSISAFAGAALDEPRRRAAAHMTAIACFR